MDSLLKLTTFAKGSRMAIMSKLYGDERGVMASTEIIIIMMLLVFGLIAGNVALRDAVSQEVADTGLAINNINQSYSYAGNTIVGVGTVAGSEFADESDDNDGTDTANQAPPGLNLSGVVAAGE